MEQWSPQHELLRAQKEVVRAEAQLRKAVHRLEELTKALNQSTYQPVVLNQRDLFKGLDKPSGT